MKTLFDLGALPEKPEPKPDTRRWYITVKYNGKEYALVATHSDGSLEWSVVGTFRHQPHLYRTYNGAKRQGYEYVKPGVEVIVKEWTGWKSE